MLLWPQFKFISMDSIQSFWGRLCEIIFFWNKMAGFYWFGWCGFLLYICHVRNKLFMLSTFFHLTTENIFTQLFKIEPDLLSFKKVIVKGGSNWKCIFSLSISFAFQCLLSLQKMNLSKTKNFWVNTKKLFV
jgi:hypothetical protein